MARKVDDRTLVLAALQQIGITPAPDEVDALVAAYPAARVAVAGLYAVPGARYADPVITFDARLVNPGASV
jgi:hypothetical protein